MTADEQAASELAHKVCDHIIESARLKAEGAAVDWRARSAELRAMQSEAEALYRRLLADAVGDLDLPRPNMVDAANCYRYCSDANAEITPLIPSSK